jgi:hypothetical protein
MRTGEVEANILRLNEELHLPDISELVARKVAGGEHVAADRVDLSFVERQYLRLRQMLDDAQQATRLPETPSGRAALNDLLLRVRTTGPHAPDHHNDS